MKYKRSNRRSTGVRIRYKRVRRTVLWLSLLAMVWLMCSAEALADSLIERQQAFPNWQSKPKVENSSGDLAYPTWMAGRWRVTSTLVDMVAPLAPEIVTPGFEGNRQFLDQPITAEIRFVPKPVSEGFFADLLDNDANDEVEIVSDRAFNGLSLARAYLGEEGVQAVKVDPDNPNRQITFLKGDQQLISTVTGRRVETPNAGTFATTEVFQQFFRSTSRPNPFDDSEPMVYLNEVENTTVYRKRSDPNFPITGDQITAIYLSPKDPNYFQAKGQPVALYRYQLSFSPIVEANQSSKQPKQ